METPAGSLLIFFFRFLRFYVPCLIFFLVRKFFVLHIFVEETVDALNLEVGDDLAELIDPDIESLEGQIDLRFSFQWFFLGHGEQNQCTVT